MPPLPDAEVVKIATSAAKLPAGALPKGRIPFLPPREAVVSELKGAFETAADPKNTTQEVQWIVRGFVAVGAITLVTGKPKLSGKSTTVGHMLARVLDGVPFIGLTTVKSPVVVLTEERTTFTELLKRIGVIGREDFRFLRFDPGRDATFAEMVTAARQIAKEIGARILVVDTLAQFLGLRGDAENEAGSALEALKPLQEAAQDGLAVIAIHHEKKGGGDVGDSGRGSSAFMGAVDIILSLRRPEGQTAPGVRVIHSLSRYTDTPEVQYLELTDHGYEARDEGGVVSAAVEQVLLQNAPTAEADALAIPDLIKGSDVKEPTARKVAKKMVADGKLHETGDGVRGSPRRYWKSPPTDSDSTRSP